MNTNLIGMLTLLNCIYIIHGENSKKPKQNKKPPRTIHSFYSYLHNLF